MSLISLELLQVSLGPWPAGIHGAGFYRLDALPMEQWANNELNELAALFLKGYVYPVQYINN